MKYENLTSRWIPECGGWSLFSCAMRLSSWKENNPPPKTAQRQMRNNFIRYQPEANCDLPHWRCFLIHLVEVNNIEHMQTMCKMICKSISRDLTCNVCTIREHSTFPLPCCCRSLAPKLKRSNYSSLTLHVTFGGCTKSDIFSVGVVAFQAACGKHPFINEDLLDVQDKLSPPDFFLCVC